mmetsp:Transcript_15350/g.38102  ORF Transcript_15350/g.38102 Transcript_15350/m.38102 type:complete len:305 (+) Transcript_15350:1248-2162(+)
MFSAIRLPFSSLTLALSSSKTSFLRLRLRTVSRCSSPPCTTIMFNVLFMIVGDPAGEDWITGGKAGLSCSCGSSAGAITVAALRFWNCVPVPAGKLRFGGKRKLPPWSGPSRKGSPKRFRAKCVVVLDTPPKMLDEGCDAAATSAALLLHCSTSASETTSMLSLLAPLLCATTLILSSIGSWSSWPPPTPTPVSVTSSVATPALNSPEDGSFAAAVRASATASPFTTSTAPTPCCCAAAALSATCSCACPCAGGCCAKIEIDFLAIPPPCEKKPLLNIEEPLPLPNTCAPSPVPLPEDAPIAGT